KNFTEEVILGEMYAQALENAGIKVDRKLNLGTTDLAQGALVKGGANGGIDLYPEYTGTGLIAVLKASPINDPEEAYQAVKKGYAAQADGTAGPIAGYNLVLLDDPKHYGPPDNVSPVVRDDVLAMYPQLADTLNKVSAKVTNEEISALNWDVDGNKKEPAD